MGPPVYLHAPLSLLDDFEINDIMHDSWIDVLCQDAALGQLDTSLSYLFRPLSSHEDPFWAILQHFCVLLVGLNCINHEITRRRTLC